MINTLPVLLIFINLVLIVFLVALYIGLKKWERSLDSIYDKKTKQELERAKNKALSIVENAQIFTEKMQKEAQDSLEKTLNKTKQSTDDFLKQLNSTQAEKYDEFLTLLHEQYKKFWTQEQEELKTKTINKQLEVENIIDTKMKESLVKINDYEKAKKESIDKEAYKVLQNIIKENIPNYISVQDHQKLVAESVEQAKKQGFFKEL
jgi:predicted MPP superfamily phosphohydrolase